MRRRTRNHGGRREQLAERNREKDRMSTRATSTDRGSHERKKPPIAKVDNRPREPKAPTLVETAYSALRREILEGALKPGAKLRTEELRARYKVSGSTIREALTRLLGEALVTAEGQRGFRLAAASIEDFRDLSAVRRLVETEALRQAIAAGGEAWEADIVAAFSAPGLAWPAPFVLTR